MHESVFDYWKRKDSVILVSYYRTGTHYLLMCLEKYFNQHVLLEKSYFYEPSFDTKNILLQHFHDPRLGLKHSNVIYLYRQPTDVVFSRVYVLNHGNAFCSGLIDSVTREYLKNIEKWILEFPLYGLEIKEKTVIRYENLLNNFFSEFSKVVEHLCNKVDINKIKNVQSSITKDVVRQRTVSKNIIPVDLNYENKRREFSFKYKIPIEQIFFEDRNVEKLFKG